MTSEVMIIFFLLIFQVFYFILTYFKEKSLLDRIMAKSLVEFKDNVKAEANEFAKDDPNIINLDEAKEELNV